MESSLEALRERIDSIDSSLVKLLNDRAAVAINIGLAKKSGDIHVPNRELAVYEKVKKLNPGPLTDSGIQAIYREIMSASISLQKETSIAYLGPIGTFTHQAALTRFGDSVNYSEQATIDDVFSAIETGTVTYGVVPFENSTFGSVQQTLDRFASSSAEQQVKIRAESYLPIHHYFLSNSSSIAAVARIYSHPEAFGQCKKWIQENVPSSVEKITVSSTALAAEMASKDKSAAAICSDLCSRIYGVQILASNIEDLKNNTTRFLILGRNPVAPSGSSDKTLVSFSLDHRKPGALCDALDVLKQNNINISKIDSRPSRQRLWHYYFFLELEGHSETIKTALDQLELKCHDFRIHGSFHCERNVSA